MFRKISCVWRPFSTKTRTVDPKQMENFDDMAKIWWDSKSVMKLLHDMNGFRVPWVQKRLTEINVIKPDVNPSNPFQNISFLDVGCGGGFFSEAASQMGADVVGIDPNAKLIEVAKEHAKNLSLPNLRYLHTTIEEHVLQNKEKYDVVTVFETIEHVREQELFVKLCVECLKPGGSIFFTTNGKTWISYLFLITFLENILRVLPKGTHIYDDFVDKKDLIRMLKNENCATVSTCGYTYNFFTKTWYLTKIDLVDYAVHAIKAK